MNCFGSRKKNSYTVNEDVSAKDNASRKSSQAGKEAGPENQSVPVVEGSGIDKDLNEKSDLGKDAILIEQAAQEVEAVKNGHEGSEDDKSEGKESTGDDKKKDKEKEKNKDKKSKTRDEEASKESLEKEGLKNEDNKEKNEKLSKKEDKNKEKEDKKKEKEDKKREQEEKKKEKEEKKRKEKEEKKKEKEEKKKDKKEDKKEDKKDKKSKDEKNEKENGVKEESSEQKNEDGEKHDVSLVPVTVGLTGEANESTQPAAENDETEKADSVTIQTLELDSQKPNSISDETSGFESDVIIHSDVARDLRDEEEPRPAAIQPLEAEFEKPADAWNEEASVVEAGSHQVELEHREIVEEVVVVQTATDDSNLDAFEARTTEDDEGGVEIHDDSAIHHVELDCNRNSLADSESPEVNHATESHHPEEHHHNHQHEDDSDEVRQDPHAQDNEVFHE